jgi:hypothetical protein
MASVLFVAVRLAGAQQFIQAPRYSTPEYAGGVVVGDFNNDGNPDVVFGNECCGRHLITVQFGNGDGTFRLGQQIATGQEETALVGGDWNGDGVTDLAVAETNATVILLGNGDGTFRVGNSYPLSFVLLAIAAGDLNGDGISDLVISTNQDAADLGYVLVQLGHGDGTFSDATSYPVPGEHDSVAVGDLNNDGKVDVATTGAPLKLIGNLLEVFLGNGDGTLQSPIGYVTDGASAVAIADLNGDGITDFAASGRQVQVFLGNGNGTFKDPQGYFGNTGGNSLSVVDVNQDGIPDLLDIGETSISGGATLDVLIGNGDGTFAYTQMFGAGFGGRAVAIADFNNDGQLDAVATEGGQNFDVLLGSAPGKFVASRAYALKTMISQEVFPRSVVAAKLDSDNSPDLLVANETPGRVIVLHGAGDGTFGAATTFPAASGTLFAVAADLNLDGKNDIITANSTANSVSVLLGRGDGTFQAHVDYAAATDPEFVLTADVNGDGRVDVITANKSSASISVFLSDGSGKLSTHKNYRTDKQPVWLATGDLNHDGKLDIVAATHLGAATVLLGNGDGTFARGVTLSGGKQAASLAVGDLNGDGNLDVLIPDSNGVSSYEFLGNGDGTFAPKKTLSTGKDSTIVLLGDYNRDGKLDAVLTNSTDKVNLMFGNGDGTFQTPQSYTITGYLFENPPPAQVFAVHS